MVCAGRLQRRVAERQRRRVRAAQRPLGQPRAHAEPARARRHARRQRARAVRLRLRHWRQRHRPLRIVSTSYTYVLLVKRR